MVETIGKDFLKTLTDFLTDVSEIITDLVNEGIETNGVKPASVDTSIFLLKAFRGEDIMEVFVDCYQDWGMIAERNRDFIRNTLKQRFSEREIPFDTNIISAPFESYEMIKSSPEWENLDPDDIPLVEQDIVTLWGFFDKLVRISCRYIKAKRVQGEYRPSLPLEHYEGLFSVQ